MSFVESHPFFVVELASIGSLPGIIFHNGFTLRANIDPLLSSLPLIIDGQTATVGTWVLIKDQINEAQNGLYWVAQQGNNVDTQWVLERRLPSSKLKMNTTVHIKAGNTQFGEVWQLIEIIRGNIILTTPEEADPITAGSDGLIFARANLTPPRVEGTVVNKYENINVPVIDVYNISDGICAVLFTGTPGGLFSAVPPTSTAQNGQQLLIVNRTDSSVEIQNSDSNGLGTNLIIPANKGAILLFGTNMIWYLVAEQN